MLEIINTILFALWFFLPVGLATLGAFFSSKIPVVKKMSFPLDFYFKFRGKRILGSHKTIRGLIFGVITAILTVYIQIYFYNESAWVKEFVTIDYTLLDPVIFGFLCGFGAIAGDAIKSFFKRQNGIAPGQSWFPFDQIDHILGGILCTWFYIYLSIWEYFFIFVIWFLIHPLFTFIGFLLKLKKKPL